MKFEISHLQSKLKDALDETSQLHNLVSSQNNAIDEWQKAVFAKDKKLMMIEKKIDEDRKKSDKETIELMKVKIPEGCQEAINWAIDRSNIGKP